MKRNHDYAVSLVRLTATALVIACHVCEHIGYDLADNSALGIFGNGCSVGVQLFLILSGYLYGSRKGYFEDRSRAGFIVNNFSKILVEYYVYVLLVIFPVYYFLQPELLTVNAFWRVLTCSGTIWGVHHLWYIPYILFCYLLTPLLYDIKAYFLRKRGLLPVLLLLAGLFAFTELAGRAFDGYFIIAWINCYILGFFLPDILHLLRRRTRVVGMWALIALSAVLNYIKIYVRYELEPALQPGIAKLLCAYYINYSRMIFALALFGILMYIGRRFTSGRAIRLLDLSDKYSYDIFIVHMIYVKGVLSLMSVTGLYALNTVLVLAATVLSAVVFHYICSLVRKPFKKAGA